MTAISRTYPVPGPALLVAVALAAAIVGGVVGGIVATRIGPTSVSAPAHAAVAPPLARASALAAQTREWERVYREQHPTTLTAAQLRAQAAAGREWQRQYEQQHPQVDSVLTQYGREWQRQYEQQHPQQ